MDILNFISWIKRGDYRATLPTDVNNLIAVGSADPKRDDSYRPLSVNAAPLLSVYDKGTVAQLTNINTPVTLNTHNGIITTVSTTLAADSRTTFLVNNSNVTAESRILLSVSYPEVDLNTGFATSGMPIAVIGNILDGSFEVVLCNTSSTQQLNYEVKVHFIIIV